MANFLISTKNDGVYDRLLTSVPECRAPEGVVNVEGRTPAVPCYEDETPLTKEEIDTYYADERAEKAIQQKIQEYREMAIQKATKAEAEKDGATSVVTEMDAELASITK